MSVMDMRVWVGCIGCYNAAHLVGKWFDADEAPTEMAEFDRALTAEELGGAAWNDHAAEAHEELWVYDHEGFNGLLTGECSPVTAREIAEAVESLLAENLDAFAAWCEHEGHTATPDKIADLVESFEEAFCGYYERPADYAAELAEEIGAFDVRTYVDHLYSRPGERPVDMSSTWPFTCIDWERAWRELDLGGDNYAVYLGDPRFEYAIFRSV